MMERVRSSRATSGGVEVARRGVAGRQQPTLGTGPDVRVRSLKPIIVLPYLRRPTTVETSKGNASKSKQLKNEGLKLTCGAGCPVGRGVVESRLGSDDPGRGGNGSMSILVVACG